MNCPKCGCRLKQHVSVFVEADADCRSLGKKGIRSAGVTILGVGWPQAVIFCPNCPYRLDLNTKRKKK